MLSFRCPRMSRWDTEISASGALSDGFTAGEELDRDKLLGQKDGQIKDVETSINRFLVLVTLPFFLVWQTNEVKLSTWKEDKANLILLFWRTHLIALHLKSLVSLDTVRATSSPCTLS